MVTRQQSGKAFRRTGAAVRPLCPRPLHADLPSGSFGIPSRNAACPGRRKAFPDCCRHKNHQILRSTLHQRLLGWLEQLKQDRMSGNYLRAFSRSVKVLRCARSFGMPPIELEALWEAMDCAKVICPGKKSLLSQMGKRSLALAHSSQDRALQQEANVRWGSCLRVLGRNQQAIRMISRSLKRGGARNDFQLFGYGYWNLGFALRMQARLQEAKTSFRKAIFIFKKINDASGYAYAICGLAGVTRLLGGPESSLSYYRQAFSIFKREKDPYGLAYAWCGQGNALRRLARHEEAIAFYRKAQKAYQRLGDQVNRGYVLWGYSLCLKALGEKQIARQKMRRAASIFTQTRDARGLALIHVWGKPQSFRLSPVSIKEARLS